jgi:predicted nucleic acid-binding protein
MKIYLDSCCLNRPFDDQSQLRIRLESEAKLKIQEEVRIGNIEMVWSYILDFENAANPYPERLEQFKAFKYYAMSDIEETSEILSLGESLMRKRIHQIDALHVACAIVANCDYFLTTDDRILNQSGFVDTIKILNPVVFIIEGLSR